MASLSLTVERRMSAMRSRKADRAKAAALLGSRGGKATATNRTAQQRREAALHAIRARWQRQKAAKP